MKKLLMIISIILLPGSSHETCITYAGPAFLCRNIHFEEGKQLLIAHYQNDNFKYVIFEKSTIPTVPVGVFSSFTTVTKLFLSHNEIRNLEPGAFSGMTNLEELHLGNNHIALIPRRTFSSLSNLKVLDLSHNSLLDIEDFALYGLEALQKLDLSNNNLSSLNSLTFSSLSALETLHLSNNQIFKIDKDAFLGLGKLETLVLDQNILEELPVSLFKNTTSLRSLDIEHNRIQKLDFSVLPLPLTTLKLGWNTLSDNKKLSQLTNLQELSLLGNRIEDISELHESLISLNFAFNNLRVLNSSPFIKLGKLQRLDLSHNRISHVTVDSFRGLSKLEVLDLDGNRMRHLTIGCFSDLTSLHELSLQFNDLTDFELGTFAGLHNLDTLKIGFNSLTVIHENSFHIFNKLTTLELEHNAITSFNAEELLLQLKNLKSISFYDNKLPCDTLLNAKNTFRSRKVYFFDLDGGDCANDTNNHNYAILLPAETATKAINVTTEENLLNYFDDAGVDNYFEKAFKNSSSFGLFNEDSPKGSQESFPAIFNHLNNSIKNIPANLNASDMKALELLLLQNSKPTSQHLATETIVLISILAIVNIVISSAVLYILIRIRKYANPKKDKSRSEAELELI